MSLFKHMLPKTVENYGTLNGPCSNKVVKADRCPAMGFEENHQVAKTDEDHNMNVLPHWIVKVDLFVCCCLLGGDNLGIGIPRMSIRSKSGAYTVKYDHHCFGEEEKSLPSP